MNESTTICRTAVVLPGSEATRSRQGSLYAPGVSAQTVDSQHLFLGVVTIAPGERTKAHVHEHHESAFYMLSGEAIELWSGERLEHRALAGPGDYLYIPPRVPHVAVNRSRTLPAVFVGARNEPTAMESVSMRPELDAQVP
jgi:uncharacterized RmlC-like cupin family protein